MRKPLLGELKARALMMHPAPMIVDFPYRADWYPDCVVLYYIVARLPAHGFSGHIISTRVAAMRKDMQPVCDLIVTTRHMTRRETRHYDEQAKKAQATAARQRKAHSAKRRAARARV